MDLWLPPILAPVGTYDLVRLGRERDGGYLVDPLSVAASTRLISFGMQDDWSFEQAFRESNAVPVDIFDHTVDRDYFFREAYHYLLRWDRFDKIRAQFRTYLSFRRFFRDDVRHHSVWIGYDWPNRAKSLQIVLDEYADPGDRIFLKIDIESWEYRITDQIIANADRIEGITIEFHHLDLLMPRLLDFVACLPLHLCHIHANNSGGVDDHGTPLVLELSFSRHAPQDPARPNLPHPLDAQNYAHFTPYQLKFRDT